MTAAGVKSMVERNTRKYGITITWPEQIMELNSRGIPVPTEGEAVKSARVILIQDKYSPLNAMGTSFGISVDMTRYLITLPNVEIKKDMIITDNHGQQWRVGFVNHADVAGITAAKWAYVTDVYDAGK